MKMEFIKVKIKWRVTLFGIFLSASQIACQNNGANLADSGTALNFSDKYHQSLQSWNQLKAENGTNYSYTQTFASWVGHGSTTKIHVQNDTVVKREYSAHDKNNQIYEEWYEQGAELGSHEAGAALLTANDIYLKCKNEVLSASKADYNIYFNVYENGVLSICSKVSMGCADDCGEGYEIRNLEWTSLPK